MRLDDDSRRFLYADLSMSVDPTGSTVTLKVDDQHYTMAWQGDPVPAGSVWNQTARTVEKFCGSAVTPEGADVSLVKGTHQAQPIVWTTDGQIVPSSQVTEIHVM